MEEHTGKLLPIRVLHEILFNEDVFRDFLERKGAFESEISEKDLKDINDYMKLVVRTSKNLDSKVYSRINAVNIKFGNKDTQYKEDKYATGKLVAIDSVEHILNDEDVFNKFMNYETSQEYFTEGSLINYLIEIVDYFNYVDKNKLVMDYEVIKRYHAIMKKYSLYLKKYHKVNGNNPNGVMSLDMEAEILGSVDYDQDRYNVSYQIYRELNKRCRYSSTHVALDALGNKTVAMEIYNKNIADIDNEDNEVTCNSWANMYAYLLMRCGYDAKVCGEYHKYVEFDCDGTLMRADATDINPKPLDGFYLNDITRCQLGLQVDNFRCLEKEKELDDIIDYAYQDSSDYNNDKLGELRRIEQCYKNEYMNSYNKTPVDVKITMIKKKCLECGLKNAELIKYIDLLMGISFSYQELKDMDVNYIAIKEDDNKYSLSVIFNLGEYYYIFDEEIGLVVRESAEVIDMFKNGDLVLVGKNARCRLLESNEENAYARVG